MNRRNFLRNGSMAGIALTSLSGCTSAAKGNEQASAGQGWNREFELDEISIAALQEKMKSGKYTAESVTRLYLNRINEIDKGGPHLNAVIELNPDAIQIARDLDKERKSGKVRGPLHGIPVLIKDNIDTADKMKTTAGSLALADNIAAQDAFVVARLREAGAVILGKTNLSEWANFRSTQSTSGWSSRGGQTGNPYIIGRNPLGSSAGSGAAVSANLCAAAIGTETDGSITCPSSVNGLVGIKPTVGLVSRAGIIPISKTQDTAGPMARSVADAAALLGVITGADAKDPVTAGSEGKALKDYTKFLDKNALQGKRIGIEKRPQSSNPLLNELFGNAVKHMQALGATVVELEWAEKMVPLAASELELLKFEFRSGLNEYLSKAGTKVRSLKDVIAFNTAHKDKAMPYFGQELLEASEKMEGLDSKAYTGALAKTHEGIKALLDEIMKSNDLHALCGLTFGPAHATDLVYGDRSGDVYFASPAAMAGYPHITLPCGQVHGLPIGISLVGTAYSEPALIGMAYAFEQSAKARVKPEFKTVL